VKHSNHTHYLQQLKVTATVIRYKRTASRIVTCKYTATIRKGRLHGRRVQSQLN